MKDGLANELGAVYRGNGKCSFRVWAPKRNTVDIRINNDHLVTMKKDEYGYFTADAENIAPGSKYKYRLDGGDEFPDPASHFQPEGVHGPSEVVDHAHFHWHDNTGKDYHLVILSFMRSMWARLQKKEPLKR